MSLPSAETVGESVRIECDGITDDLLSAGLGLAGLRGPVPAFLDPCRPTRAELRRRAVHGAYRGLVDTSEAGGLGRLYGPVGDVRVAGIERLGAVPTAQGRGTTTVMLQVPRDFDPAAPRLLAVASSGSRGIYGALPTAAEWGLRHGFAVVHTDKGTGNGVWDLDRGRGYRIDGTLTDDPSDPWLSFVPEFDDALAAYRARQPHTLLFKHAHSRLNPEADWGRCLLQAVAVALRWLAEEFPAARRALQPGRALVLAAGISNGGAAVLRALEEDRAGWLSGGVAFEPSVVLGADLAGLAVRQGETIYSGAALGAGDYTGLHYLLQPAAALAAPEAAAPLAAQTRAVGAGLEAWGAGLRQLGVLAGADPAAAARARLLESGILPEALRLGHFNLAASLWPAITAAYASAYARRSPADPPTGTSYAATQADGQVRALTDEEAARLWSDAAGIPPTGPVSLVAAGADGVRRAANGGRFDEALGTAPARALGAAPAAALPGWRETVLREVTAGRAEAGLRAQLGNRPVVIVHGRADGLIPVNHTSRAYYALNARDRGARDELRYYELEHGQHFDAVLADPEFAAEFVPMQAWLGPVLEAVIARLERGAALPPSQVIRSRPRGRDASGVPPLAAAHLGELRADPGADAIRYLGGRLEIPA